MPRSPDEIKEKRVKVQIKGKQLFINDKLQKKHVVPPSVTSLFYVSKVDQKTAQDRSSFCILHILNEISQRPELMDTLLVGNHCHIF